MVNRDNKVDNPLQSLDVLVLLRHYNIAVVDADQYYNPCDLFGSVLSRPKCSHDCLAGTLPKQGYSTVRINLTSVFSALGMENLVPYLYP